MNRTIEKIDNIYIREGKLSMPCKPSEISDGFVPYKWGAEWTDTKFNSDALFRFNIDIPETKDAIDFADKNEIAGYAQEAVQYLQQRGIISGYEDNSFGPKNNATRAEVAVMLYSILPYTKLGE